MEKRCENCIHIVVCDKQKVTNHKISKSVCKHYEKREGCTVCKNPAKWFAIFREPYGYLKASADFFEDGKIKVSVCPMCGRKLKEG